jgi:hypothetical protein
MWENFLVVAQLTASQEGLSSMELVRGMGRLKGGSLETTGGCKGLETDPGQSDQLVGKRALSTAQFNADEEGSRIHLQEYMMSLPRRLQTEQPLPRNTRNTLPIRT